MGTDILGQGITLMLVGMGTVFVFLTLLVVAMSLMATIAMRFSPQNDKSDISDEEVAAVAAAINLHKKR